MAIELGTRGKQGLKNERLQQGSQTRSFTRDLGMTKNVTASVTFSAGSAQLQAANGTFPATGQFQVNDPILVEGSALNNGYFTITALDGANGAFLTVDPPPKSEGPVTVTVRTP